MIRSHLTVAAALLAFTAALIPLGQQTDELVQRCIRSGQAPDACHLRHYGR